MTGPDELRIRPGHIHSSGVDPGLGERGETGFGTIGQEIGSARKDR